MVKTTTRNGDNHQPLRNRLPDPIVTNGSRGGVLSTNSYSFGDDMVAGMLRRGSTWRDGMRDINSECGYPSIILASLYRELYDRNAIARRVCNIWPRMCFKASPLVYEDESAENATEFEDDWDNVSSNLSTLGEDMPTFFKQEEGSKIWHYAQKGDILSRVCTFGIILVGIDDGKPYWEPVDGFPKDGYAKDYPGVSMQSTAEMGVEAQYQGIQFQPPTGVRKTNKTKNGKRKLVYLKVYDESLVQPVQYEADPTNPRYGRPVRYLVMLPSDSH